MKVSCERCRKVFKVPEGRLNSRGSVHFCPRCGHSHTVFRIVQAAPLPDGSAIKSRVPQVRDLSNLVIGPATVDRDGTIEVKGNEISFQHTPKSRGIWETAQTPLPQRLRNMTSPAFLLQLAVFGIIMTAVSAFLWYRSLNGTERQIVQRRLLLAYEKAM